MRPYRGGSSAFFFFNDTATTEIYTLSLHDALPILSVRSNHRNSITAAVAAANCAMIKATTLLGPIPAKDRKSTRLNFSHAHISYAVFCLQKKYTWKQCVTMFTEELPWLTAKDQDLI